MRSFFISREFIIMTMTAARRAVMVAVTINKEESKMAAAIKQINFSRRFQLRGRAASVGGFLWHFVQMVIAMEIGMMVYHLLISPLLAQTAYAALTDAYPIIGYWMMIFFMALGMLSLMLYQKSSGRYCLEMMMAMLAPVAALTVLVLCSLMPSQILYGLGDPTMFLAMAAYMLYRPHEHAHGAHEHASSSDCHTA